MDYTVHEILQARILEWVAFPFSRGSSLPRDCTQVFHIAGGFFTSWATRKPSLQRKKKKNSLIPVTLISDFYHISEEFWNPFLWNYFKTKFCYSYSNVRIAKFSFKCNIVYSNVAITVRITPFESTIPGPTLWLVEHRRQLICAGLKGLVSTTFRDLRQSKTKWLAEGCMEPRACWLFSILITQRDSYIKRLQSFMF